MRRKAEMRRNRFQLNKKVRNEQLVRQLDRRRHRELFMVVLTGLVLTVAIIAYAWPHFQLIRIGYRMEELRVERERLTKEKRHLELQLATEASPDRIESISRHELGMVYPGPDDVVVIEVLKPPRDAHLKEAERGQR